MKGKIIDIHTHLADFRTYHDEYIYGMVEDSNIKIAKDKFLDISKIFLSDEFGDKHILKMDKAGIEKSVLLIIDSEIGLGQNKMKLADIYKAHKILLEKYPERFLVFGGIDPRRSDAAKIIEDSFYDYNFSGVKLYPSFGFPLDHPNLDLVYRFCSEKNLPVLTHTGPSVSILNNNDYSNPVNIRGIAKKYSCNFILAHAGFKLNNKEISSLLELPNVYFDISGFRSLDLSKQVNLDILSLIFTKQFSNKILFGTDWPLFHMMNPIKKDIEFIENLFDVAKNNKIDDFDIESLEKIMYKNSLKILSR